MKEILVQNPNFCQEGLRYFPIIASTVSSPNETVLRNYGRGGFL